MGNRTGNPRGRPKGSPNKATAAKAAEVAASGLTPLDFMLSIMRDETKEEDLLWSDFPNTSSIIYTSIS